MAENQDGAALHAELERLHGENRQRVRSGAAPEESAPDKSADRAGFEVPDPMHHMNDQAKAIYGVDNRTDICDVQDPAVLANARATVALIGKDHMSFIAERWVMRTARFGTAYRLCSGQTFENQPIGPHCSGFLVAEDIVATAAHCVETEGDAKKTLFVFDFDVARKDGKESARVTFASDQVYAGAELIGRVYSSQGADWALVRLDRPVPDRAPMPVRRAGKIADGQPVYVIGHPCGLPKKYAPDSKVVNNRPPAHFEANLDTFGGNSGSPVFNAESHEVEGILVRGQTDFWMTAAGCQIVSTFPSTGPQGESVCRCTEFAATLDDAVANVCPPDPDTQPDFEPDI